MSNLATVALLSTTLTIALGSEPGWPADRLSDSVLAMIYAGADLAGTLGGSGNGNGNGNIGNNNGNGNIGNNNGNGNVGSNNGNGNPSSNNGNGNSGNGKGNGSSLNGVNGNLSNAVGLRPLMVAGNSGVIANAFVGPTTMGGVVPLLPGQGLLPMSGPVIAPATQALVPVTPATFLGGR